MWKQLRWEPNLSQSGANMSTNKNANSSIKSARLKFRLVWLTNEKFTENQKANKKIMWKQLGWEPNLSGWGKYEYKQTRMQVLA